MAPAEDTSRLVIEGWIDAGGHPFVLVSTPVVAMEQQKPATSLSSHVVAGAKVSVTDDEGREYWLEGRVDRNYLPPYVYTTEELTGEVGHNYRLKVNYGNHAASGTTTIPRPLPLDRLEVTKSAYSDTLFLLTAWFTLPPGDTGHYRFFTRVRDKETMFYPSLLSGVDAHNYTGSVPVMRSWSLDLNRKPLFSPGEVVDVRFCAIDDAAWAYWESFDAVASLGLNPFFPSTQNPRSNLQGAFGYWAGYGVSTGTAVIE
jgi:hypothetical protein